MSSNDRALITEWGTNFFFQGSNLQYSLFVTVVVGSWGVGESEGRMRRDNDGVARKK